MFGFGRGQVDVSVSSLEFVEELSVEEEVHTSLNPYCGDMGCWCHTSVEYHDQVTTPLSSLVDDDLYDFALGSLMASH